MSGDSWLSPQRRRTETFRFRRSIEGISRKDDTTEKRAFFVRFAFDSFAAAARLASDENPRLPGASTLLDIEETENAGKRAIAAEPIEPGDRLVVEAPYAATLLPEFFGTHCQHCFSR